MNTEPVRIAVIGAFGTLAALLVIYGVWTQEQAGAWVAAGVSILTVAIAVSELVRARVTPAVAQPDGTYVVTSTPDAPIAVGGGK